MIISTNRKTGFSLNFNPRQTCDKNCPFYESGCYGFKGTFNYPNVTKRYSKNLDLYYKNPDLYFQMFEYDLIEHQIFYFRVNGNGDTPDKEYAKRLFKLIRKMKHIKFWIATRKEFYKGLKTPSNCIVRYSAGIKGKYTSNVSTDINKVDCPCNKVQGVKNCMVCGYKCWSNKKNITYLWK